MANGCRPYLFHWLASLLTLHGLKDNLRLPLQGLRSPLNQCCLFHIPHISAKFMNPPIFVRFRLLASLCFAHDAFTHHALHVLDAPVPLHTISLHPTSIYSILCLCIFWSMCVFLHFILRVRFWIMPSYTRTLLSTFVLFKPLSLSVYVSLSVCLSLSPSVMSLYVLRFTFLTSVHGSLLWYSVVKHQHIGLHRLLPCMEF